MTNTTEYGFVKSKSLLSDKILIRAFLYEDYRFQLHSHDFFEINIIIKGTGTHTLNNREIQVKAGDVFVIPPYILHAYSNTSSLTVLHFVVAQSLIMDHYEEGKQIPGFLQFMEIEPYLRSTNYSDTFLRLSPAHINGFMENGLPERLLFKPTAPETTPLIMHSFFTMLYTFSEYLYEQINARKSPEDKYSEQIIKVLEYIHVNYDHSLSIDELCKLCFMSRSTFLRTFEKICGCTPREYQSSYRAKKAVEMMENTNRSKTEIAHICGFYDLSHMERTILRMQKKGGMYGFASHEEKKILSKWRMGYFTSSITSGIIGL